MSISREFRLALEAGDVGHVRMLWSRISPHLPQPEDRRQAEIMMHMARTCAESLPLRPRAYSHRWLTERAFPSGLPDHLKPRAERLYPVRMDAVGISVKPRYVEPEHARAIQAAMEGAVEEMYAEGDTEPVRVKGRIMEVHDRVKAQ